MSYVDEVLVKVKEKNASEPEFLQAVEEVLNSLRPVIPNIYPISLAPVPMSPAGKNNNTKG